MDWIKKKVNKALWDENQRLQEEISRLKSAKLPESKKYDIVELGRFDGHIFYKLKDFTDLPYNRVIQVNHNIKLLESGVDKSYLSDILGRLDKAYYETNDPRQLGRAIEDLRDRIQFGWNTGQMWQIAGLMIMRDDEEIDKINQGFIDQKITTWKRDKVNGYFFLNCAFRDIFKQTDNSLDFSPDGLNDLTKLIELEKATFGAK